MADLCSRDTESLGANTPDFSLETKVAAVRDGPTGTGRRTEEPRSQKGRHFARNKFSGTDPLPLGVPGRLRLLRFLNRPQAEYSTNLRRRRIARSPPPLDPKSWQVVVEGGRHIWTHSAEGRDSFDKEESVCSTFSSTEPPSNTPIWV